MIPLSLVLAYLLGSVSPSYLLGRLLKGIDLREHGSGNVGATNAFRVLGKGPGIVTLLFDAGKGFVMTAPFAHFMEARFSLPMDPLLYRILLGFCVIAGHNWSCFLKFKGGKGVATTLGVFLALSPGALLWGVAVWVIVTLVSRNVGVGSMVGALATPVAILLLGNAPVLVGFGFFTAFLIVYTHRSNIRKIFFGKKL